MSLRKEMVEYRKICLEWIGKRVLVANREIICDAIIIQMDMATVHEDRFGLFFLFSYCMVDIIPRMQTIQYFCGINLYRLLVLVKSYLDFAQGKIMPMYRRIHPLQNLEIPKSVSIKPLVSAWSLWKACIWEVRYLYNDFPVRIIESPPYKWRSRFFPERCYRLYRYFQWVIKVSFLRNGLRVGVHLNSGLRDIVS